MFLALLETALVSLFAVCLVWAAVSDVMTLKIPNGCSSLVALSFFGAAALSAFGPWPMGWATFGWHMLTALGALVFCYALFAFGKLGAGDGKLVAVMVMWLGPVAGVQFLLAACLAGGAMALGIMMFRHYPLPLALATHPAAVRLHTHHEIPYGVPLAIGGFFAIGDSRWAAALPIF